MIGIYCIKNRINGKVYIGQSWDIENRWYRHRVTTDKSYKSHLYSAIRKYGKDNFEFSILKKIEENENTQKELDHYENFFIEQFNSRDRSLGYNKKEGGSRGRHSKESNTKNRLAHLGKSINVGIPKTEEAKRNMSLHHADVSGDKNPNFGKKHSLKTKEKISKAAKKRIGNKNSFFGKHHSIETRIILSEKTIEKKGIKVYCLNNSKIYRSMNESGRDLNIQPTGIARVCRGKQNNFKGYNFYFI